MNSLIICPSERAEVIHLAESAPLVNNVLCGKPFIFYWIEFLVAKGAKRVVILAPDRPDMVRGLVEDGSRWGVSIEVVPERTELSLSEARAKYLIKGDDQLPSPYDVCLADHLPEAPEIRLFESYASFFNASQVILPKAQTADRIGVHELSPGVWVGMHSRIPASTKFVAPVWIGDSVLLGENVQVGPYAVVESRCIVEEESQISHSIIPPETFIGAGTDITNSLLVADNLINWKLNSSIRIADAFLVTSLNQSCVRTSPTNLFGRFAALVCLIATAPLAFIWTLVSNLRSQTVFRTRQAVDPFAVDPAQRTIGYMEFANCTGLWQRWPQLWNIVRGEFAWVGNRPLNIIEAGQFTAEFEKLWFKAPIGLVSQADAEGCFEKMGDESRVHACFYAVNSSRRLDFSILWKVIVGCGKRNVKASLSMERAVAKGEEIRLGETALR